MKMKFEILYKSGKVDEFVQNASEEQIKEFNEVIYRSMRDNEDAVLTLGDSKKEGMIIRARSIDRLKIIELEGEQ